MSTVYKQGVQLQQAGKAIHWSKEKGQASRRTKPAVLGECDDSSLRTLINKACSSSQLTVGAR
jgi:hypothetical protein